MAPRSGEKGSSSVRRFFLARTPDEGRPELLPGDQEHALRVLRIGEGDRLIGLDGRGRIWPLAVKGVGRGHLELEAAGEGRFEPPPGSEGAPLPWIEIALPWPKGNRCEEMLDRLTQLGAAAIADLASERSGQRPEALTGARRARAERILREACKQSGRAWLPELRAEPCTAFADRILLDPSAERSLTEWIRPGPRTRDRPLSVLVGPEGGFTDAERAAFVADGAVPVRLGPHVLRLETAAEAAMAVLGCALTSWRRT